MKDFCSRDSQTMYMQSFTTEIAMQVEQYRKKFIKEAKNLARLHHQNIISVIEVFEENDTVYYVMPYYAGGSLLDYVTKHGALSESEAMKYVKQIASALKYMHEEQHICHYDVKPANILLDDKGNAVLIDFGISKNYDSAGHETTSTPIGLSDGYAPIEQYNQNVEEFSPASDVYALGATLYFLLHGKRPVSAVLRASGTPLLMRRNLSQDVKDIINASMKLVKGERASSVDVFNTSAIVDRGAEKDAERFNQYANEQLKKGCLTYIITGVISLIILLILQNQPDDSWVNNKFIFDREIWVFIWVGGSFLTYIIVRGILKYDE